MLNRRRVALALAGLATLLALGHLLDPHGEFGGFEADDHVHAEHGDHGDGAPGHQDHDEICGQVLPPDSGQTAADLAVTAGALPEPLEPLDRDTCADTGTSRSPPDPVAQLQVNRV